MIAERSIGAMSFVEDTVRELDFVFSNIKESNDYDENRKIANYGLGVIRGVSIAMNAMISTDNNDFTGDFSEWLDYKEKSLRGKMDVMKALNERRTNNDTQ